MPVYVTCEHCGSTLPVPDELLHRQVRCGKCGSVIVATPRAAVVEVEPEASAGVGGSVAALVLGIIGLVAWCIPLIGFPVNIIGLILGCVNVRKREGRGMAVAGIVLCSIGLILSVINAVLGAMMALQGVQLKVGH